MTRPIRLLALLGAILVVGACTSGGSSGSSQAPASAPSASAPPAATIPSSPASTSAGSCPTSQPPALAAGEKRVVTIDTAKGRIEITVEADLGPQAAGNFVALASCGFYDGLVFHRIVPGFVIQGGDPEGTGRGGPGYQFADDPVKVPYVRGVVAMANAGPNTNGSQFFIVLKDGGLDPLYSIFGRVTSGMEAVDAIAAAADKENPSHPIAMDKLTVSTP
jgi:cyclophilin family peptidyl-prolyl cis-trans isomerase